MSLTINGAAYDEDLFWVDQFATPGRAGSTRQTMGVGGRTVRQSMVTDIKRTVTLEAELDGEKLTGRWTHAQVQALKVLEKSGASFDIVYEGETVTVQAAPNCTAGLVPLLKRPNMSSTDLYHGSAIFQEI